MSNNKKKATKAAKANDSTEDDWEAVLAAEAAVNATLAPVPPAPAATVAPVKGSAEQVKILIKLSFRFLCKYPISLSVTGWQWPG